MSTHEGSPKKAKGFKSLTVEAKARLIRWLVQTEPCVIPFMNIVKYAREDETIKKWRPVKGKPGHRSGKWVIRLYKKVWADGVENGTVVDKEFRRMIEGCAAMGRGKNIKECVEKLRSTTDHFDLEIEEEIEGGSEKRSEEETGRINSGSDHSYEDGSLATDESEKMDSNNGSEQVETSEEQVGDEDANNAEADDQNQANTPQISKPEKRGRRSHGESSRSSSGGTAQVEHSGMGEVALKNMLKNRTKSQKKKQKTGDGQDGELDGELDDEQEAGEISWL
ncbi:uncharacterized protein EAF01_007169 [Botrytis porri]|uniref:Uncharacterized protein n=1 Tax=Botrytis porri TaxID=87229 RepID=A0A4Z1KF94_9HELO|nr:uncharacterized protein EAF01_007169 [Botrytis porri]KAF7901871.1 hypothetical protein EAF01_007169 [Botrytis porri]TGO82204.1 hypothetical protein BPOR_0891g00010 [Botrytis porri]